MTHLLLHITDANALERWAKVAGDDSQVILTLDEIQNFNPQDVLLLIQYVSSEEQKKQLAELLTQGYAVILFSNTPSPEEAIPWFERGIKGYLNTFATPDRIRQAIQVVRSGNIWLGQSIMQAFIQQTIQEHPPVLPQAGWQKMVTDREREVLEQVMLGKSNQEIAELMNISERTVKAHMSHLLEKFSTKDRLALVLRIQNWQD
ncbi:MAG: response regulator transcription factor [Hydrogenovibrio sp.]|nr:response regulator transcription factor [Hydrogenovibrio sp.]